MKIAFIVGCFPVLSETFIINQITGLIDRGHEVDIYGNPPDDSSKVHPDVNRYQLLAHTHYPPKISKNYLWRILKGIVLIITNFHKSPLVILQSLNFFKYGKQVFSLRLLYSVMRLLEAQTYDIIHCQFGTFALEGMILRDIGAIKGKLITTFRGYDISLFVQQNGEHVYDSLFSKGDFFLANCEYFQKKAIKLGCNAKKIVVHGSGIDSARFPFQVRHPHPDGKTRITTTGRLIEKKGIEYGIRAVAKVSKIYPKIEYNIIGDGYLQESLQQLIQSLNIADKVQLLGWKNQPEIIEILDKSDIFMAPSVTAISGNQDAPVNTLKEAMVMGLPVIATIHGGIPELVKDGISGFLVPERDSDAIAEKLVYLIEHPEIWPLMGQAGRAYVESNYDINKLNDELVQIYRRVMMNDLYQQEATIAPIESMTL
ncbi:glycosyltransferase [Nostocaceae cyanobacterium CENA357]|uniref:Glycosyltransferase n=1 Tax=Atlanticothrix silvestris CENA357 TaxID=1725252 RepID=A0A8J7HMY6_9CYAN|nr:glycosyltransferase [Atlanticothrix silvestris]MBH8555250.1 glycosyltransferase [Atlanticothrix silvestris CENA357]